MKNLIIIQLLFIFVLCNRPAFHVSADFISFRRDQLSSNDDNDTEAENFEKAEIYNDGDAECRCFHEPDRDTKNNQESYVKIAYLISLHNERTLLDAFHLFRAIRSPYSLIAIHIDTKLPYTVYQQSPLHDEINDCPCGSIVHADSIYSAEWGQWSMNEPTIWGMNVFTQHERFRDTGWEVFINLSADSLPVYKPQILSKMFSSDLKNINFVTSSICETGLLPTPITWFPLRWHKRTAYDEEQHRPLIHYINDNGRSQSITIQTHFGSQWMTLTKSFVTHITEQMSRPDSLVSRYAQFLQDGQFMVTDETFFSSLLMNLAPFNTTQVPKVNDEDGSLIQRPDMYAIRYERMDEHGPTASGFFPTEQRYEVPESAKEYGVEDPKVWGPYFLGVYDLANIKRSGALFIRKVSVLVEPNLLNMLPVDDIRALPDIEWVDLKISEFPDWEKLKAQLIEKAKARMKREEEQQKKERGSIRGIETDLSGNSNTFELF